MYSSLGSLYFTLTTTNMLEISVDREIVDVDAPHLIGLNILDDKEIMIDNVHKRLSKRRKCVYGNQTFYLEKWYLHRSFSTRLYALFHPKTTTTTSFTTNKLQRLHIPFSHLLL